VEDLFGTNENIPMDERVCRAVAKVRGEIKSSTMPNLPLFWTEWNVQGMHESRDTPFVGPAVANTLRQCDGLSEMMSFWTFSDVFEEGGPIPKPFIGEFGLRAKGGINKPSYYAWGLLHELGDQRLSNEAKNAIVTKTSNGDLAIVVWNLVDPDQHGETHTVQLSFSHVAPNARVNIERLDEEHGNVLKRYEAMGSPLDPTPAQVDQLNRETALPAPESTKLRDGKLELQLTPNALVLIKLSEE
jgi:xylan 1,4-beta-xylosidase